MYSLFFLLFLAYIRILSMRLLLYSCLLEDMRHLKAHGLFLLFAFMGIHFRHIIHFICFLRARVYDHFEKYDIHTSSVLWL